MGQNSKHSIKLQLVLGVLFCAYCSDGVNGQISPCPQVFEYKYDGYNSYGIARLPTAIGTNNLQVKLALDRTPDQPNPAQITILDNLNDVIQKLQTGGNIKYKIGFPPGITSTPEILSIMLNGQEYCENSEGHGDGTSSPRPLPPQTTSKPIAQPIPQPPQKPSSGSTINFEPQSDFRPNDYQTIRSPPQPLPSQTTPTPIGQPIPQPPQKPSSGSSINSEPQSDFRPNDYQTIRSPSQPLPPQTTPKPISQPIPQPPQTPSSGSSINFEHQSDFRPNDYQTISSPPRPSPIGLLNRVQAIVLNPFKGGIRFGGGFSIGR